jgi:hypothetical protein
MKIIEKLKENSSKDSTLANSLYVMAKSIAEMSCNHLKQIIAQLPEYDLHDEGHADKVLLNIEKILGTEGVNRMSSYELFLTYLSAYLHDFAMALPEWELRLLKITEGTSNGDETNNTTLKHDLKAPLSTSAALSYIESNKQSLYDSFSKLNEWPFISNNESDFQKDLARRLISYQDYRNGFSKQLEQCLKDSNKEYYDKQSIEIRQSFIRDTHHTRVEDYVRNLGITFQERLSGSWGKALADDLAKVCRSHGENFKFVEKLNIKATYFGDESANLQYISILLRLGDIIHFSADRAPGILFTEKIIESKVSKMHWNVKNQGVNYSLGDVDNDGRRLIKFIAYCESPEPYYFLQDYLNLVDHEIGNYFKFYQKLTLNRSTLAIADRYCLNISDKVDRNGIRYNEDNFTPVQNLCFTLNQRRILELLMGVGLYKNKHACIRELYQNALDSCRCMVSIANNSGASKQGEIEFGIGIEKSSSKQSTYLYCRDNGIGMTPEVIEEYLMKVGNSFYGSAEFRRKSIVWKNSFTPTSQFGIGILSCFMIGERIEITTKPMPDWSEENKPLRFAINGPHEHFYYLKPDELDLEKLGTHGTIVKVFLKEDEVDNIKVKPLSNVALLMFGQHDKFIISSHKELKNLFADWDKHLYKIVSDFVSIVPDNLSVMVRFLDNTSENILNHNIASDYKALNIPVSEIQKIVNIFKELNKKPLADYLDLYDHINTVNRMIEYEGMQFNFILNLPKPSFPKTDNKSLDIIQLLGHSGVLIDGISVVGSYSFTHDYVIGGLTRIGIVNFTGKSRPQLSVDRTSITSWPDDLNQMLNGLLDILFREVNGIINEHIEKYRLDKSSYEVTLIWEYILKKFYFCSAEFVHFLIKSQFAEVHLNEIEKITSQRMTINQFVEAKELKIKNIDYRQISYTIQLLILGKLAEAERVSVFNDYCTIDTNNFYPIIILHEFNFMETAIIIKADDWKGDYYEYDILTSLWPIVPERLFSLMQLRRGESNIKNTDRAKAINNYTNSINAISYLDPVQIHPKLGLYKTKDRPLFYPKKELDLVYKFGDSVDIQLFDINEWHVNRQQNKRYVLYSFITPRKLNELEERSLAKHENDDPEYAKGVRNGWSILFLGGIEHKPICLPGKIPRKQIIELIPDEFRNSESAKDYFFLDGTKLFESI